jgi:hypothetical protein
MDTFWTLKDHSSVIREKSKSDIKVGQKGEGCYPIKIHDSCFLEV